MKNHGKRSGNLVREFECPFCGGRHRNHSTEARECRRHRGRMPRQVAVKPEPVSAEERVSDDILRRNQRVATIARKARAGWTVRKIAKHLNISVADVRASLDRTSR